MKKIIIFFSFTVLLIACENKATNQHNSEEKKQNKQHEDSIANQLSEVFVSDTIFIEKKFKKTLASDDAALLESLGLCAGALVNDSVDVFNPPCDGRLFRIFQLNDEIPKNELIAVEVLKDLYGNKDNKIVVLAKVGEEYITLTSLIGYLLEFRTNENGFKDFLVLHPDRQERMSFEMNYSWDAEARKYLPKKLERVDNGPIKNALTDSLTQEAIELLTAKNIIIED